MCFGLVYAEYCCQVLCLVYASHNGISEMELFDLVPSLQWSHWSLLCHLLIDWHILSYLSGLLVFAHEQVSLIDWHILSYLSGLLVFTHEQMSLYN